MQDPRSPGSLGKVKRQDPGSIKIARQNEHAGSKIPRILRQNMKYWIQDPSRSQIFDPADPGSRIFLGSWHNPALEVKPLTIAEIWWHVGERAVKGLSSAFFRALLAVLVHELQRLKEKKIIEITKNPENLTFDDLWWPYLWPDLKND